MSYTELAWIKNTGKQYIDVGFKPNQDTRVKIRISEPGKNAWFFSVWSNAWNINNYSFINDHEYSSGKAFFAYGNQTGGVPVITGENEIDFNKNTLMVNGVVVSSFTYTAFQSLYNMFLFARNNKGSVAFPSSESSFRLHECQIYSNETIVRDLIPVLDENGVACLYDKVSGAYFYNKGSGTFTAGPKKVDSVTFLQYIGSTGTQYIDLGFPLTERHKVEIKFTVSGDSAIFGSRNHANSNNIGIAHSGGNVVIDFCNGSVETYRIIQAIDGNSAYRVVSGKNGRYIYDAYGNLLSSNTTVCNHTITTPGNAYLFNMSYNANGWGIATGRIYYCKIYNGDSLICDLYPAVASDGTVGMWDAVTRVLYINAGTGTFVAGPLKSNNTHEFGYTGATEEFIVPCTGRYKLEAWGAQGGSYASYRGGYGGYSVGFANLSEGDKLYIAVGGEGSYAATKGTADGGFNGGGMCRNATIYCCGAGGGATHIAKSPGLLESLENNLDSILLVAGGGAGCFYYNGFSMQSYGNSGGGYHGGYSYDPKMAGTQDSGYTFGKADTDGDELNSSTNFAGGGGGFYGGYSRWGEVGAGGGSGYIGNEQILEAYMVGWSVPESVEKSTLTKNTSNYSNIPTSDQAKVGNGYVRITLWTTNKYLLRSGSTIYTITDGALTALVETEITANLFQTYGVDELPDSTLLLGLTDPEILYWHDSIDDLPTLTASVTGTPPLNQVIVTDVQPLTDPSIIGIESVEVEASDDVLWAVSFDDGTTWKAYDGTQWAVLAEGNSGMAKEVFESISVESWASVYSGTGYRIRFVLPAVASYTKSLTVHYLNKEVS